ncbi:MAG: hypothetical protein V4709_15015 [Pseudomonadota bacterium]
MVFGALALGVPIQVLSQVAATPAVAPAAPPPAATAPLAMPAPASPVVSVTETPRTTVPERHAQKRGFVTCAAAVTALSQHIVSGSKSHQALTTASDQATDQHALHTLVIAERDGSPEVFSMYVTPSAAGGCDSGYSSVRYFDSSCAAARETAAADYKYLSDIGSYATYVKGSSEYLTLIPLPKGCLSIRSETIY